MGIINTAHLEHLSRENLQETCALEERENSRLRELLLGMAGRPEITKETRAWLAAELKRPDKAHVVDSQLEDDNENFLTFRGYVERLVNLVREATGLTSGHPPDTWYARADGLCDVVADYLHWTPERTLRQLKKGE